MATGVTLDSCSTTFYAYSTASRPHISSRVADLVNGIRADTNRGPRSTRRISLLVALGVRPDLVNSSPARMTCRNKQELLQYAGFVFAQFDSQGFSKVPDAIAKEEIMCHIAVNDVHVFSPAPILEVG